MVSNVFLAHIKPSAFGNALGRLGRGGALNQGEKDSVLSFCNVHSIAEEEHLIFYFVDKQVFKREVVTDIY